MVLSYYLSFSLMLLNIHISKYVWKTKTFIITFYTSLYFCICFILFSSFFPASRLCRFCTPSVNSTFSWKKRSASANSTLQSTKTEARKVCFHFSKQATFRSSSWIEKWRCVIWNIQQVVTVHIKLEEMLHREPWAAWEDCLWPGITTDSVIYHWDASVE